MKTTNASESADKLTRPSIREVYSLRSLMNPQMSRAGASMPQLDDCSVPGGDVRLVGRARRHCRRRALGDLALRGRLRLTERAFLLSPRARLDEGEGLGEDFLGDPTCLAHIRPPFGFVGLAL